MASVDFDFISELEGNRVLEGYVPAPDVSQSGVTVATGIDLGQFDSDTLRAMGVSVALVDKLSPYFGLKKQDAVDALADAPLRLTADEARELDACVKGSFLRDLERRYDGACRACGSNLEFTALSPEQQTVIASVAFQYGVGLDRRTPNFWNQVTTGDWDGALANLRNFGDAYDTRRNKEADLLASALA